jgi:pimeloyl-ACP methyl ester carboxylesterase
MGQTDGMTAVGFVFGALVGLTALVWLGLRLLRRSLTPARLTMPPQLQPSDPVPQAVWLPTVGHKRLHAWWLPALGGGEPAQAAGKSKATPAAANPQPAPAAVLMHGWGGNGATLWRAACALHQAGFAVLLPDARSHGLSDGDTFSSLPRFAQDLAAGLDWVAQQPGTDAQRLCALGHSVGGAAALLCASQRPGLAAVVSVSAFAHPEQVMRRWLGSRHIPYWPLGWVINRYVEHVIGHRFNDIAPVATVARIACPVLLVHGLQDDVVPLDCAQQLVQRAQPGRVQLLAVPGTHDQFDDEAALLKTVAQALVRAFTPTKQAHLTQRVAPPTPTDV